MNRKLTLTGLVSLAMLSGVSAAVAAPVQGVIYGINASSANNNPAYNGLGGTPGGIYSIDVTTGATSLVATTTPAARTSEFAPNTLSRNATTGTMYFTSCCTPTGDKLYSTTPGSNVSKEAGTLQGSVASGTYYKGNMYYMNQGDTKLRKVSIDSTTGLMTSDVALDLNLPSGVNYGFGDIAVNEKTGVLYGAGSNSQTGKLEIFTIDLTQNSLMVKTVGFTDTVFQIAFLGDTLYGTAIGGGNKLYQFNETLGKMVDTGVILPDFLKFNDLANGVVSSSPVPEPMTMGLLGLGLVGGARRLRKRS